jgi:hypothetical protein
MDKEILASTRKTNVIPFPTRHPQRATAPRTRRERYIRRLFKQAAAGDIGAVAEVHFAGMRDALLADDFCPHYWAETGIAAVRKLRRQVAQLKGGA